MIAALVAYVDALVILALVGEAHSLPLIIAGWVTATWMIVLGSLAGWQAARQ